MKQQWTSEELLVSWTLTASEKAFINNHYTGPNRVGIGALLKCFQQDGRFPQRKQDVPGQIIVHIAQQLNVHHDEFGSYGWSGGTIDRHRAHIRSFLGFRTGTTRDVADITKWLFSQALPADERQLDRLREAVYTRFRDLKIEPPEPKSIDRLIRSALRSADEQFYSMTTKKLSPQTREKLDALLNPATLVDGITAPASVLQGLRSEAGLSSLESVFAEIEKLERIRSLDLPSDLFSHETHKVVSWHRTRVAIEDVREIRRHPSAIRYTLLAAYCWQREEEIIDTLIELLINLIHRIEKRAERTVDKQVLRDVKRIRGKHRLLYEVAQASIQRPEGTIKEVIYPVAPEQTLRSLVEEFRLGGSYDQKVQLLMRGSYSNHYRRMVPLILKILSFCQVPIL